MPCYKEMLSLIRAGRTPQEIMKRLNLPPSKLRRMMKGKRLGASLKIERELTGLIVSHCTVTQVHDVIKRFIELMEAANPETARKVCLALISEGLQSTHMQPPADEAQTDLPTPAATKPEPWKLLKPATTPPASIGKMPRSGRQNATPKNITN